MELPAEQRIELVVTGPGKAIQPFALTLAAPPGNKPAARVESFLREYKAAFTVSGRVLDLFALECPGR
jgi:hypothetical protein